MTPSTPPKKRIKRVQPLPPPEGYITTNDAIKMLGVGRSGLYVIRNAGKLEAYTFDGYGRCNKRWFKVSDLQKLIEKRNTPIHVPLPLKNKKP